MSRVEELVLARVNGYAYPSDSTESDIFVKHFNTSKNISKNENLLWMVHSEAKEDNVMFSFDCEWLLPYIMIERTVYKQDTQCDDMQSICKAYTTIILVKPVSCKVNIGVCNSVPRIASTLCCAPQGSVLNSSFLPGHAFHLLKEINSVNYYDKLVNVLLQQVLYPFSIRNSYDEEQARDVVEQQIMGSSTALLEYSHDTQLADIRNSLHICATQLGVSCFSVDARQFSVHQGRPRHQYQSPACASCADVLHAQSNQAKSYQSHTSLSDISVQHILRSCGPCVLHLEGVDLLFDGSASPQHPSAGGAASAENEVSDAETLFVTSFHQWLAQLHAAVSEEVSRSNSIDVLKQQQDFTVVVVASTKHGRKMRPSTRNVFSTVLNVDPLARLSTRQVAAVSEAHGLNVATLPSGVLQQVEAAGNSFSAVQTVLQECKLSALRRVNLQSWVHHCGLTAHLHSQVTPPEALGNPANNPPDQFTVSKEDTEVFSAVPSMSSSSSATEGNTGSSKYATSISPVHWADIGGLDRVRREIMDVLELPFLYPHLFPPGCPRRQGVLLYGPPGTGKTLVAKAVATECNMAFLSIKGPELLDSYVGESERNVRELFACARAMAPCVLFFDEIDSLAPARARGNDSGGGVMDRIVSQLLTEIDNLLVVSTQQDSSFTADKGASTTHCDTVNTLSGVSNSNEAVQHEKMSAAQVSETAQKYVNRLQRFITDAQLDRESIDRKSAQGSTKPVFIIGATNRPDLLDPALLRPGRFDRKVYLGVCKDVESRVQILAAQTRKFTLHPEVDLVAVAAALPDTVTGADIGAVTTQAYSVAIQRKLEQLTSDALGGGDAGDLVSCGLGDAESCWKVKSHLDGLDADALTVLVTQNDLLSAALDVQPSQIDLTYYEELGRVYDDTLQL